MDIGEQAFLTVFGDHGRVIKVWVWKRGWDGIIGAVDVRCGELGKEEDRIRRRAGFWGGYWRIGATESAVIGVFENHR